MADPDYSTEIWKPILGFEGRYEISSMGRARNASSMHVLKPRVDNRPSYGYARYALYDGRKTHEIPAHRLVCTAFHGPAPSHCHEVAHWNGVRLDNRVCNLRWATRRENMADKRRHGTDVKGRKNPRAVLTEDDVRVIRSRRASGETMRAIAAAYGVHKNTIWWATAGGSWSDVI